MLKFAPKNHKQLLITFKTEKKIFVYKKLFWTIITKNNLKISNNIIKYFNNFHLYYKSFSSFSRLRKNCILTGRSRSIYRTFQLSRIKIKEIVNSGKFFGISKASW